MDAPNPLIVSIRAPEYKKVIVEASDGYRYYADLSSFSTVYCFPKTAGRMDTGKIRSIP